MPFTITFTQLLICMGAFFLLFNTRGLWSWMLPGVGVAVVMAGLPFLAAAAFGAGKIEGRGLPRYLRGMFRYQAGRIFARDPSKQIKRTYHLRSVVIAS